MKQIKFENIQIPISDEELWGYPDAREIENCYYWPFGQLLANFYKLAKKNLIKWPVLDVHDLRQVTEAMEKVFTRLQGSDIELVEDDYQWFLDKSKIISWQPAGNPPDNIMSPEEYQKYLDGLDGLERMKKEGY